MHKLSNRHHWATHRAVFGTVLVAAFLILGPEVSDASGQKAFHSGAKSAMKWLTKQAAKTGAKWWGKRWWEVLRKNNSEIRLGLEWPSPKPLLDFSPDRPTIQYGMLVLDSRTKDGRFYTYADPLRTSPPGLADRITVQDVQLHWIDDDRLELRGAVARYYLDDGSVGPLGYHNFEITRQANESWSMRVCEWPHPCQDVSFNSEVIARFE